MRCTALSLSLVFLGIISFVGRAVASQEIPKMPDAYKYGLAYTGFHKCIEEKDPACVIGPSSASFEMTPLLNREINHINARVNECYGRKGSG